LIAAGKLDGFTVVSDKTSEENIWAVTTEENNKILHFE
jgi:hypothetical protein